MLLIQKEISKLERQGLTSTGSVFAFFGMFSISKARGPDIIKGYNLTLSR